MIFNIPQFIDIEDKIVGPLTAKQLGWLAAAGVCMLVAWTMLDMSAFIMVAIPLVLFFGGMAFYRPNGQPLTSLISAIFVFFMKPKLYIWRRVPDMKKVNSHEKLNAKNPNAPSHKEVTLKEIADISQLLEIKKQ